MVVGPIIVNNSPLNGSSAPTLGVARRSADVATSNNATSDVSSGAIFAVPEKRQPLTSKSISLNQVSRTKSYLGCIHPLINLNDYCVARQVVVERNIN